MARSRGGALDLRGAGVGSRNVFTWRRVVCAAPVVRLTQLADRPKRSDASEVVQRFRGRAISFGSKLCTRARARRGDEEEWV